MRQQGFKNIRNIAKTVPRFPDKSEADFVQSSSTTFKQFLKLLEQGTILFAGIAEIITTCHSCSKYISN